MTPQDTMSSKTSREDVGTPRGSWDACVWVLSRAQGVSEETHDTVVCDSPEGEAGAWETGRRGLKRPSRMRSQHRRHGRAIRHEVWKTETHVLRLLA